MSTTKAIPGIQRGPDFDREANESYRVKENAQAAKMNRPVEVNDPIVSAAVEAASEMSEVLGREIDVQFDTNTQTVIMTIYSGDGEKIIHRLPPEEVVRMSQRLRNDRSSFVEKIL